MSHQHYFHNRPVPISSVSTPVESPSGIVMMSSSSSHGNQQLVHKIKEDWNHLETMMVSIEGMVVKTQKALSNLRERIDQIGFAPSPMQLRQYEMEREQALQSKIEQAVEEVRRHATEEKQRLLLDATKQMRDAIRESNLQVNCKESCWNCGRKATETCSGCNKARYCGTFCQHRDWDRHMKHCNGARSNTRGDKERNSITISTSTHNHTSTKPPHYITGPLPTGSRIVRTTSRTPTPTSYGGTEILVPLHTDPLANGNTTLTATSTGVAVVTINRSAGDLTTTGGSLL